MRFICIEIEQKLFERRLRRVKEIQKYDKNDERREREREDMMLERTH
jgi:hypothetical protein